MKVSAAFKTVCVAGFLSLTAYSPATLAETRLQGSGASFPYPIYSKWFQDFSKANKDARVDYQSKGSGAGIRDFVGEVVDFAGSDAAMSDEEIAESNRGAILLPMTAGEIVLAYNLPGVSELKLPRDVYPEIFAGNISKWNDSRIADANPGVDLPDRNITVVVRSDSSGTTYVFTGHLSNIHEGFKAAVGQGKAPQWPQDNRFVKAPKNDGITAQVKQIPGAIGYIEYGYAKLTNTPVAALENRDGSFVLPGPESGAAALAAAPFPTGNLPNSDVPDLRAWVWDPEGAKSYPIATFTWMIFPTSMGGDKARVARDLVEYCLTTGQESANDLGYIPLPDNVRDMVRNAAAMIQ